MKKRFWVMLLAIVMLLGLLAACGEQASVTESTPSLQMPAVSSPVDTTSSTASAESTETVDSSSTLLPDLEAFLYYSASTAKKYGDYGYQRQWNGSHPLAAYETVSQELLDLLAEDRYQLKLKECVLNSHYAIPVYDYYYDYTGTSKGITKLVDKYEEYEFDVSLSFSVYPDDGYFKISLNYSRGFVPEDPGTRTTRNIDPSSDGGVIPDSYVPDSDDDNDFWKKCSACHGSGNCTHCGGDDEVRKFQAGLGWVEQNCTFCTGGRCRSCNGTGKD